MADTRYEESEGLREGTHMTGEGGNKGERLQAPTRGEGKGGGERELGDCSRRGGGQGGERSACAADARW